MLTPTQPGGGASKSHGDGALICHPRGWTRAPERRRRRRTLLTGYGALASASRPTSAVKSKHGSPRLISLPGANFIYFLSFWPLQLPLARTSSDALKDRCGVRFARPLIRRPQAGSSDEPRGSELPRRTAPDDTPAPPLQQPAALETKGARCVCQKARKTGS